MPKEEQGNFGLLERAPDEEGEDETSEDGVLFLVNKGGFPIDDFTWDRMWNHVAKLHPDGQEMVKKIKKKSPLPEVPIPVPPLNFPPTATVDEKLNSVQKYMSQLQYNHTGTQFFEVRKNRPISGLLDTAKDMMREALPIKCLEATILAIFLTNGISGLDRFPLSFKTVFGGQTFRHVVLGVYCNGYYGALGMSRREDLMFKPLEFKTLSSLLLDFKSAYQRYFHSVKKMKVGLPVPHDPHSYEPIVWKKLTLSVGHCSETDMARDIDRFARDMRAQTRKWEMVHSAYNTSATIHKKATLLMSDVISPHRSTATEANKNIAYRKQRSPSKSKKPKKKRPTSDGAKGKPHTDGEDEEDDEEEEKEEEGESTKKQPVINYQVRI